MIHLDHPAADGKDLRRLVHGPLHGRHKSRLHPGIVVQKKHIGRVRRPDPRIDCAGKPCIFLKENRRDPVLLKPLHTAVCGTVVHHQDLEIPDGLLL